ncbi:beta-ketoacyl synthase N-terminal-like domain-containing protein [Nonomuraea guangzhouensis]|uniref:Beta-ketoacyl synthase N-terminal-like domain-containing protein n=1 Tax=Nonomuraea guangzhouensis TaxID=1291555 RepID=A0ABW4GMT2_9ACTN|nr:beta-ketoacyl synthase N-terminal-like domain-containing protein [Nonomuraea guangzhouensis]
MNVWVTGMAWSTALGDGLAEVWRRLLDGDDGFREVPSEHRLRNLLAATLPDPPPELKPSARQRALAEGVLSRALADAGLTPGRARESWDGGRSPGGARGSWGGDGSSGPASGEARGSGGDDGPSGLAPGRAPDALEWPSGVASGAEVEPYPVLGTSFGAQLDDEDADLYQWAADVAAGVGLRLPPVAVSTACSSGSDALAVGAEVIRSGVAEVSVCGAADVVTPAKRLAHTVLGTMSPTRLRAFDRRADGTLLGEAAGFVVLEREESARARGAEPYAVLAGTGAANDGAGMTAPDPAGTGVDLSVRRCLAASGLGLDDIAVINAHGSGTPVNDAAESGALSRLFAGCAAPPVVFATKGALGHTLGATGVLEAIAVVLALHYGTVPPVVGLEDVPAGFPLPVPAGRPSGLRPGAGLSLTLGFGGFITSLAFTPGVRHVR